MHGGPPIPRPTRLGPRIAHLGCRSTFMPHVSLGHQWSWRGVVTRLHWGAYRQARGMVVGASVLEWDFWGGLGLKDVGQGYVAPVR